MVKFIPVRYAHTKYPDDIKPKIQETTANFFNFFKHKKSLQKTALPYLSLHTDPGYRGKKDMFLSSEMLNQFPVISKNVFDFGSSCVSKLWFNEKWSKEFSGFLVGLTEGIERQRIKVIEVHPPIDAYCDSLETFLKIYAAFEEEALNLHSPAPFLPRTSFHECSIDGDHLRPPAVEGQVIHIAETRRFYFSN